MKPYYEYGGITIYHGDCRDILPQLPDTSIDMVFTDPPYGHNNNNDNDMIANWEAIFGGKGKPRKVPESEYRPIVNDGQEANDLYRFCLPHYRRLLRGGGCCCCCCCCGGGGPDPQFARWSLWLDEVIPFKMMVVWDKGPMGMGHHYRRSYETVLVAAVPGASVKWYDASNRIENIIRPGDYGIKKIIPRAEQHPTLKPVALPSHFIRLHTQPGEIVLDPFMGSGTTLCAAKCSGRSAIGIEIEERYCEIATKRLAQEVLLF